MRFDISLTVEYDYDSASDHARNLLHVFPAMISGRQNVIAGLLSVDPVPPERWDGVDFFGNPTTWISFHQPIDRIEVSLRASVERLPAEAALELSVGLETLARDIASVHSLEPLAPHHFLGPSVRTGPEPDMTAFARACLSPGMTTAQAVAAIGHALYSEMTFDAEATDVHTPPAEAFANRHGVCQDFTHIMIACLRGIGIPAGYVSGFLRTLPPPGQPRLEGADAMHAWVRAWCGREAGWIEFDPTNDVFVAQDHIVIGFGRDYFDVAPVRGMMRTAGGQASHHSVDVVPAEPEPAGR
ncbi:transglutaminase family protein [Mesobacterium sp. TK19101]|uniref:Transglutaminase family protein n=1 Tax=Mesobacterium hydrothermale TaxID=3111907 RepID=A0ABU6HE37_9RHOB|nr:transglutaminase family protein [Mesobacterium sp. TK19101]MEC3860729.1 transglutaminase family protein [Mesobacterium sp. TK19101]